MVKQSINKSSEKSICIGCWIWLEEMIGSQKAETIEKENGNRINKKQARQTDRQTANRLTR